MRRFKGELKRKVFRLAFAAGLLFQFGNCSDFGSITATTTLDGREVLTNIARSVILTPIDNFITTAINQFFSA